MSSPSPSSLGDEEDAEAGSSLSGGDDAAEASDRGSGKDSGEDSGGAATGDDKEGDGGGDDEGEDDGSDKGVDDDESSSDIEGGADAADGEASADHVGSESGAEDGEGKAATLPAAAAEPSASRRKSSGAASRQSDGAASRASGGSAKSARIAGGSVASRRTAGAEGPGQARQTSATVASRGKPDDANDGTDTASTVSASHSRAAGRVQGQKWRRGAPNISAPPPTSVYTSTKFPYTAAAHAVVTRRTPAQRAMGATRQRLLARADTLRAKQAAAEKLRRKRAQFPGVGLPLKLQAALMRRQAGDSGWGGLDITTLQDMNSRMRRGAQLTAAEKAAVKRADAEAKAEAALAMRKAKAVAEARRNAPNVEAVLRQVGAVRADVDAGIRHARWRKARSLSVTAAVAVAGNKLWAATRTADAFGVCRVLTDAYTGEFESVVADKVRELHPVDPDGADYGQLEADDRGGWLGGVATSRTFRGVYAVRRVAAWANSYGNTSLHVAACLPKDTGAECLRLLCAASPARAVVDGGLDGKSALAEAIARKNVRCARILMARLQAALPDEAAEDAAKAAQARRDARGSGGAARAAAGAGDAVDAQDTPRSEEQSPRSHGGGSAGKHRKRRHRRRGGGDADDDDGRGDAGSDSEDRSQRGGGASRPSSAGSRLSRPSSASRSRPVSASSRRSRGSRGRSSRHRRGRHDSLGSHDDGDYDDEDGGSEHVDGFSDGAGVEFEMDAYEPPRGSHGADAARPLDDDDGDARPTSASSRRSNLSRRSRRTSSRPSSARPTSAGRARSSGRGTGRRYSEEGRSVGEGSAMASVDADVYEDEESTDGERKSGGGDAYSSHSDADGDVRHVTGIAPRGHASRPGSATTRTGSHEGETAALDGTYDVRGTGRRRSGSTDFAGIDDDGYEWLHYSTDRADDDREDGAGTHVTLSTLESDEDSDVEGERVMLPAVDVVALRTQVNRLGYGLPVDRAKDGRTALHWACENGEADCAEWVLEAFPAECHEEDGRGYTPLHAAAKAGAAAALRVVLRKTAPPVREVARLTNLEGWTPLHCAVLGGSAECVEALLRISPVETHVHDLLAGATPLHLAAHGGDPSLVQLVVNASHVELTVRSTIGGMTPVAQAALLGHTDAVAVMAAAMQRGGLSKVDVLDQRCLRQTVWAGHTALHLAVARGHLDVVRVLCAVGADPRPLDPRGRTAQKIALFAGRADVASVLVDATAADLARRRKAMRDAAGAFGKARPELVRGLNVT